jgi:hypothetical protein
METVSTTWTGRGHGSFAPCRSHAGSKEIAADSKPDLNLAYDVQVSRPAWPQQVDGARWDRPGSFQQA